MNVTVRGTVPGNSFDASPYVALSHQYDTFNTSDAFRFRRTLTVDIHGVILYLVFDLKIRVFQV